MNGFYSEWIVNTIILLWIIITLFFSPDNSIFLRLFFHPIIRFFFAFSPSNHLIYGFWIMFNEIYWISGIFALKSSYIRYFSPVRWIVWKNTIKCVFSTWIASGTTINVDHLIYSRLQNVFISFSRYPTCLAHYKQTLVVKKIYRLIYFKNREIQQQ